MNKRAGKKYLKTVVNIHGQPLEDCDIYSIITAWKVGNAGLQHCLKKILMPGQRQKATVLQDLEEAQEALARAVQIEKFKIQQQQREEKPQTAQVPGY